MEVMMKFLEWSIALALGVGCSAEQRNELNNLLVFTFRGETTQ